MSGYANIEHVVVVMLENRSFDNLLGWLYEDDPPANFLPSSNQSPFDGLVPGKYSNAMAGGHPAVFATKGTTAWPGVANANCVPTPDPNEPFDNATRQIYGTQPPVAGPTMGGFLADYAAAAGVTAESSGQIMQSYDPNKQVSVIATLARQFAVSDRWFASVPSQTWPNRAFVHTGSSDGHLNNDNYELYDIDTIFETLQSAGKSWGIFHDTDYLPSLTLGQFLPRLAIHDDHFGDFGEFKSRCKASPTAKAENKLPQYSFVEPRFQAELGWFRVLYPEDYHPPHEVNRGEMFLYQVYETIRKCPYRDKILVIITFDEHGGCYDHTPPPTNAQPPAPYPVSRDGRFPFDRFGVRVPALVVSSYVAPGTVFRAEGDTPFDHTSILATLREWLQLNPFLPSPRIAAAPTLKNVMNAPGPREWPEIPKPSKASGKDASLDTPLSDVQRSVVASHIRHRDGLFAHPAAVPAAKAAMTYRDAARLTVPASRRWWWRLRGQI
jgi:phospholipase C